MLEFLILWVFISAHFGLGRAVADEGRGYPFDTPKKGRIKTNFNAVALALNIYDYLKTVDYHKLITPKTPLQKEIEAERREIAILKRHKRDMEELEDLKRQKEQLWEEVHEEEHPKFKGDDYLLKNKNLQRNEISADDITYKAMKKQSEHFEEIIREAEEEIEKRLTIIEK